jgi:hypothetical protein
MGQYKTLGAGLAHSDAEARQRVVEVHGNALLRELKCTDADVGEAHGIVSA